MPLRRILKLVFVLDMLMQNIWVFTYSQSSVSSWFLSYFSVEKKTGVFSYLKGSGCFVVEICEIISLAWLEKLCCSFKELRRCSYGYVPQPKNMPFNLKLLFSWVRVTCLSVMLIFFFDKWETMLIGSNLKIST